MCAFACASDPRSGRDSIERFQYVQEIKTQPVHSVRSRRLTGGAQGSGLQTGLPVQLQVRTVQEVGREDAGGSVRRQGSQARPPVSVAHPPSSASPSPASHAPAPSAAAPHHGDVQPVHAVQSGVSKVQPRGVRGEAQVGRVHGGGGMVQDAGRAQHLAVEVVDQGQASVWLHAQQGDTRGALQEVLQPPAARAGLRHRGGGGDEGLRGGGGGQVEGGWG